MKWMDNQAKFKRGPINKSSFEFITYINLFYILLMP